MEEYNGFDESADERSTNRIFFDMCSRAESRIAKREKAMTEPYKHDPSILPGHDQFYAQYKDFDLPNMMMDGKPYDPDHDGDCHVPGFPDPDMKDQNL